jgi:hypothetical protein
MCCVHQLAGTMPFVSPLGSVTTKRILKGIGSSRRTFVQVHAMPNGQSNTAREYSEVLARAEAELQQHVCPLLARNGHAAVVAECRLLRDERT